MGNTIYNKTFTGEIEQILITKDTISVFDPTFPHAETYPCQEVPLIKWREIVAKHLPVNANLDLETIETELKLEYFNLNYVIPSRVAIPFSEFPTEERRESTLSKQQKLINFQNKYNRTTGDYAFEFRLLKLYDSNFKLSSTTPYTNKITYDVGLNYPISDSIYNKNLPGYFNLMPYLAPDSLLMFADIKQELRVQILPRLGIGDLLVFSGGYSGRVYYELNNPELSVGYSGTINIDATPRQILGTNGSRYGFYLTNNSNSNIYYGFSTISGNSAKLILKPEATLISENKKLFVDNTEIDPGDSRYKLGLPLWCRGSVPGTQQQISIEEIIFTS